MWNRRLSNRALGPCTDRWMPPFSLPINPARRQSFFAVVLQTLPRVAPPLDTAKGRHTTLQKAATRHCKRPPHEVHTHNLAGNMDRAMTLRLAALKDQIVY